jgi:hypothetical protein
MNDKPRWYKYNHTLKTEKYKKEWSVKNRDRINKQRRERYENDPEYRDKQRKYHNERNKKPDIKKKRSEYNKKRNKDTNIRKRQQELSNISRRKNPLLYAQIQAKCREKAREELFQILCSQTCITCGNSDKRCLQFGHRNDDGHIDRKVIGGSIIIYYRRRPEEAKKKLYVTCANCNIIREYERRQKEGRNHIQLD